VIEIGCATGELIAAFPAAPGARRVGVDISPKNITAAAERFAGVEFLAGDFTALSLGGFDAVVLSDVLEHVPDDVGFLRRAASLGRRVFVNLPLEDNWLNRGRPYGPDDVSGHLRAYSREQGLALMAAAGLVVRRERRVWVHESPADAMRRDLRQRMLGQAYEGAAAQRVLKQLVMTAAKAIRPFGRRLLASNLFLMAEPRG
ncbi:MAG: class I SAM-dependent methyltransferase, partial [Hylemonella sp.]